MSTTQVPRGTKKRGARRKGPQQTGTQMGTPLVEERPSFFPLHFPPGPQQTLPEAEGGEARAEKIRRIKDLILRGEYQVAAVDIAKAIVRHGGARILGRKKR